MLAYLNQNSGALTVIFTAVVTISTVVYAVLTAILVKETRKMRQAQTEPKIEVVLKPSEEWISLIRLHIKNIGLGPAYDISFKVSAESGNEGAIALIEDLTKANFFKTGLKYLGPGHEIVTGYTQMTNKYELKIESVLNFDLQYRDSTQKNYDDFFRVDFSEFKGRNQIGTPHLYSIAESLKKLEKSMDNIATGWKRLKVDTYSEKDRHRENKEWESYRDEQLAAQDAAASEQDS